MVSDNENRSITSKKLFAECANFMDAKKQNDEFEKKKKAFYALMTENFKKGENELSINDGSDDNKVTVKKVTNTKLVYDIEKLKAEIGLEEFKQIRNKKVEVLDNIGLLTFLKNSGIKLADLKQYVKISDVVNEAKLEQELELGKIEKSSVQKSSEVVVTSEYYKIK